MTNAAAVLALLCSPVGYHQPSNSIMLVVLLLCVQTLQGEQQCFPTQQHSTAAAAVVLSQHQLEQELLLQLLPLLLTHRRLSCGWMCQCRTACCCRW
jgi:hypothetical protein